MDGEQFIAIEEGLSDRQLLMMIDLKSAPVVLRNRWDTKVALNLAGKGLVSLIMGTVTLTPLGEAFHRCAEEEYGSEEQAA